MPCNCMFTAWFWAKKSLIWRSIISCRVCSDAFWNVFILCILVCFDGCPYTAHVIWQTKLIDSCRYKTPWSCNTEWTANWQAVLFTLSDLWLGTPVRHCRTTHRMCTGPPRRMSCRCKLCLWEYLCLSSYKLVACGNKSYIFAYVQCVCVTVSKELPKITDSQIPKKENTHTQHTTYHFPSTFARGGFICYAI